MSQGFKLSLPEHIPLKYVWPVLGVLFGLQMLEGTKLLTSLAYCAFILVMTDAFNACGGLIYPSGGYIFFAGLLTLIIGGIGKTVLGEPLDGNLFDAQKSILIYLAGACPIWVAAKINAATRRKRPFLWKTQLTSNIEQAALGAALLGQFGWLIVPVAYRSTFVQLNQLLPLSLILFVYATTKKSGGQRSFSVFSFVLWFGMTLVFGVFGFSKQGLFQASLCWAMGATIGGYRITWTRALMVSALAGSMAIFLTPVSQVGRVYRGLPDSQDHAIDLLMHPVRTREIFESQQREQEALVGYHWFDHSQGLLDRLTMLPIDDALIHRTDLGYSPGFFPMETFVINMIPRYLVSSKFEWHWGNRYAHEIGLLGANDHTTGISFSPFSDLYHEMQWWGVVLVCLPIYTIMFWVCDSITGSVNDTIWACLYILVFSHSGPEGMIAAPFSAISVNSVMVVAVAWTTRYVLVTVGSLIMPPPRSAMIGASANVWQPVPPPRLFERPRTIEEKL